MKKLILLAGVLLMASPAAVADTTFYNQPFNGNHQGVCDANTATCNGTGWTVYDDFPVPSGVTKITNFTYVDHIDVGSWSDYTGTNWTVFGPNVANPFGVPTYSGTAVATLTDLGGGFMQLSITGLNLAASPGTWFVGFQNNMSVGSDVTDRGQSNVGDGLFYQQDNTGTFQFVLSGDTALSVSTSVPEPSALLMLGTGLLGSIGAIRRKVR